MTPRNCDPQEELSRLRAEAILLREENSSLRAEVNALRGPAPELPPGAEQVWRVRLSEKGLVSVLLKWERDTWVARGGPGGSGQTVIRNANPVWCVEEFARLHWRDIPVEIREPGALTRAEAVQQERDSLLQEVVTRKEWALKLYRNSPDRDEQSFQARIAQVLVRIEDEIKARKTPSDER